MKNRQISQNDFCNIFAGQFDDAYEFAQKCTEFADQREEGKAFLKEISSRRMRSDTPTVDPEGAETSARGGPMFEPMNLTFTP